MALIPTSQKRPFIPAPGVMQVEAVYNYLGQFCENVFHVQQGDGSVAPTVAQMVAVANAYINWEHNSGISMRDIGCTLALVRVRDLGVQAGPVIEVSPTVAVTGTQTGDSLPGNVTIAVKWGTGLGGRSFRGRTYHVGFPFNFQSGNSVTTAGQATLLDRYTLLRTALNAVAGCTMVVTSYAHNKFWRSTAVSTPILNASIDPNLDSQRRRLKSRGT